MAPEISHVSQEAVSESWEIQLAKSAVAQIGPDLSQEIQGELAQEVLKRLFADKIRRRIRNLDHWNDYAPSRVSRLAADIMEQRNSRIAAYLKSQRKDIQELAWRITRNWDLAEKAITQTCIELWEGRTREDVFLRALKMNGRDLLEKRATELRHACSLKCLLAATGTRKVQTSEPSLQESRDAIDVLSHRPEDQDPLDILIARQEQLECCDELEYALRNVRRPGNRWVLQKQWWKKSALAECGKCRFGSDSGGFPE